VRKIHVIGKNVWKFHAVYWPALLLSAGLPPPDEVVVHGFLTENGRKISKSLGGGIDPFQCIERFGADGVRYFLLRGVSPFADGDFSTDRLRDLYNADLANGLGNLVGRVTTLAERGGYGRPCAGGIPAAPEGYEKALEGRAFDRALESLWVLVRQVNREIEQARPWTLLEQGKQARLHRHLDRWLGELRRIACWLQPFLPAAGERVLGALDRGPVRALGGLFPRLGP
jgi:methionyl-tRNA synthetase